MGSELFGAKEAVLTTPAQEGGAAKSFEQPGEQPYTHSAADVARTAFGALTHAALAVLRHCFTISLVVVRAAGGAAPAEEAADC